MVIITRQTPIKMIFGNMSGSCMGPTFILQCVLCPESLPAMEAGWIAVQRCVSRLEAACIALAMGVAVGKFKVRSVSLSR